MNKKITQGVLFAAVVSFIAAGCGVKVVNLCDECDYFKKAPSWLSKMPNDKDNIYFIGVGGYTLNYLEGKDAAILDGMAGIAKVICVDIQHVALTTDTLKGFQQTSDRQTASTSLSAAIISGAEVEGVWVDACGIMSQDKHDRKTYALVKMPKNRLNKFDCRNQEILK